MIFVDGLIAYGSSYSGPDAAQAARVGARNGHRWCHLFSCTRARRLEPLQRAFLASLPLQGVRARDRARRHASALLPGVW